MIRLTTREKALLVLLALLLVGAMYYLLCYIPITDRMTEVQAQTAEASSELAVANAMAARKQAMQDELDALFAADEAPPSLAYYDNKQAVMNSLNTILSGADSYALNFSAVGFDGDIARRTVALEYTCGSYEQARDILAQLSQADQRCLVSSLSFSQTGSSGGEGSSVRVAVSARLTFFEYAG